MKRLGLLAGLVLASCAPLLGGGATLIQTPGVVTYTNTSAVVQHQPSVLLDGVPGEFKATLVIDGTERCTVRASGRTGCTLPDTEPGKAWVIGVSSPALGGSVYAKVDGQLLPVTAGLK